MVPDAALDPEEPPGLLSDPRYLRIWLVGWLTGVVRWLELLAFGIFAFELTGSPILVALIALMRFLPMALFGVFLGAIADQFSPRRLLVIGLGLSAVTTAVMLAIQQSGALSYWHLIGATLVSGIYWASDMPFRRKMIGEIAGEARLARAMAFDYATSNGTRMIGPLIGGVLYQTIGMGGVFALGIVLYAISLGIALGIGPTANAPRPGRFRPVETIRGAIGSARRALGENDTAFIMAGTVIFNIWGFPFVSMIPVIGKEDLALDAATIGYVASIEGLTGLIGVIAVGFIARAQFYRRLYFFGLAGHLVSVAFIGLVPGLWSLCLGLALAGFCTAAFAGMQATLIYSVAPEGMRGRYLGLISICIGSGLIGFANVGFTAELVGASNALWIIAAEGAVPVLLMAWYWRAFRTECGFAPRPGPG